MIFTSCKGPDNIGQSSLNLPLGLGKTTEQTHDCSKNCLEKKLQTCKTFYLWFASSKQDYISKSGNYCCKLLNGLH